MKALQRFGPFKSGRFNRGSIFILCGLFQFVFGRLNGQSADSLAIASPGTILFEIRMDANSPVSYLFGTHHAFGKSFFDSFPKAKEKLLSSTLLITEMKKSDTTAVSIINARKEITPWRDYLKKENLAYMQNLLEPSELDFGKVYPAELFALTNRYHTEKTCKTKSEEDPKGSLDDYIYSLAKENKLKTMGLETPAEQLKLINEDIAGMPRRIHRRRLNNLMDQLKSGNTTSCSEARKYAGMGFGLELDKPCTNSLMLTDRNNAWMTILEDKLKSESCFIAVGLSHLMYECGLVSQLQGKGFSVSSVPVHSK